MKIGHLSLQSIFLIAASGLNACVEAGVASHCDFVQVSRSRVKQDMTSSKSLNSTIVNIVFSDLDGTLIHYPKNIVDFLHRKKTDDVCVLPSSSTGMVGVISSKSLQLIREIRQSGAIFVMVSGMRSSTLLKRLPYLPKADVYCCEAGGRIFYPTQMQSMASYRVLPKAFSGADPKDLQPFSIIEDMEWRGQVEQMSAAGSDGFVGNELNSRASINGKEISCSERKGYLWDYSRSLLERGFIVDAKGYSTCFRVNRNQQDKSALFDTLLPNCTKVPSGLSSSINLGCIDFYPTLSGKKNW